VLVVKIKKFIVGIRPSSKIFRLTSLYGTIVDSILAQRGSNQISDEYYSNVGSNVEQGVFTLENKELGNILRMDHSNIIFVKSSYEADITINTEKTLLEYQTIWSIINQVLKLNDIRRIGVSAEHRITNDETNINAKFIEAFCKFSPPKHLGGLHLKYEDRREPKTGIIPDPNKSDYLNIIYDYYDSELDASHSAKGSINANLDVQRYYSPLVMKNIWDEVKIQKRQFDNELKGFYKNLRDLRLID
jgi:hypothetical protein